MADLRLDEHGRYRERGEYRFANGEAIVRWGQRRGGYAVLHRPTGLIDDAIYYTWHRTREGACRELKSLGGGRGPIRDERVIPLVRVSVVKLKGPPPRSPEEALSLVPRPTRGYGDLRRGS